MVVCSGSWWWLVAVSGGWWLLEVKSMVLKVLRRAWLKQQRNTPTLGVPNEGWPYCQARCNNWRIKMDFETTVTMSARLALLSKSLIE